MAISISLHNANNIGFPAPYDSPMTLCRMPPPQHDRPLIPPTPLTIILASTSPRRRHLLRDAGVDFRVIDPGVDDAMLSRGATSPEGWVSALSYLKARAGRSRLSPSESACAVVIGADTVAEHRGEIIGQPRDADDARRILRLLENNEHRVLTAVTLLYAQQRRLIIDAATVRVGSIGEQRLAAYIASGHWRGKAGAYNLSERLDDHWPITYEGDPATIMGLPMRRLAPVLGELLQNAPIS